MSPAFLAALLTRVEKEGSTESESLCVRERGSGERNIALSGSGSPGQAN